MTDDPFLALVVEAFDLMHPRFAAAWGRSYGVADDRADKWRERSFIQEFYHSFRTLWDRAVPVGLGLGHVVTASEAVEHAPFPDLLVGRIDERGVAETRLGAVSIALLSNPAAMIADHYRLRRFRDLGYEYAVSGIVGLWADIPEDGLLETDGVAVVFFDTERWAARAVTTATRWSSDDRGSYP